MDEQAKPSRGHGGRREGAGRKKTVARTITVGLPQDAADLFAAQPRKAEFIAEAIRYYSAHLERKQQRAAQAQSQD